MNRPLAYRLYLSTAASAATGAENCRSMAVTELVHSFLHPLLPHGLQMRLCNTRLPIEPARPPKPRLTKPGRNLMTAAPLRRAARDRGGVAERLKAADCKSADVRLRRFESYPLHQRFKMAAGIRGSTTGSGWRVESGCSSMVELQPSKLAMWVRFPSPAPALCRAVPSHASAR